MKKIFLYIGILTTLFVGAAASPVSAIDINTGLNGSDACNNTDGACDIVSNTDDLETMVANGIKLALQILGTVAVIVIIIAGFRFVTANGNKDSVAKARNTILYAAIGLVVAILSYAIVTFVTSRF
ncbi:MAG: hypothetical protein WAQ22_04335 [Candidatus Saccharimonas sp.]